MIPFSRLFKNMAILSVSAILGRILGFAFTVWVVREITVSEFGNYSLAMTYVALFLVFTDLGLNLLIQREVSQDPQKTAQYFKNGTALKGLLSVLASGLMLTAGWAAGYSASAKLALGAGALLLVLTTMNNFFSSLLLAHQKMARQARVELTEKFLTLALGGVVLSFGAPGAVEVLSARVLAAGGGFFVAVFFLWTYGKQKGPWLELEFCKNLLRSSFHFALYTIFWVIYFRIDTVMLYHMRGAEEAGLYNAAYSILEAVLFLVPAIVIRACFPVFSQLFQQSPEDFRQLYDKALRFLLGAAVILSAIFMLASRTIMSLLFGQTYGGAAVALAILSGSFPFIFWSMLLGQTLVASHQEKTVTWAMGLAVAANIASNLLVIPRFGMEGAAATTVFSEAVAWVVLFVKFRKLR